MSNNHVFARSNAAVINDDLVSPLPATIFGGLQRFFPLRLPPTVNELDAAIGWIWNDEPTTSAYPMPTGSRLAARAMRVEKWGGRTGSTNGSITSVLSTARVQYPGMGGLDFRRLIHIRGDNGAFSRPGDSGSFVRTRNTNKVVGLLFAGDNSGSLACHIETVLQAFHVSVSEQL
jgi:hypothetical protein